MRQVRQSFCVAAMSAVTRLRHSGEKRPRFRIVYCPFVLERHSPAGELDAILYRMD